MKAWGGGVELQLHSLPTSALDEGEWSTSRFFRFTPWKEAGYPLNTRLGVTQSQSEQPGF